METRGWGQVDLADVMGRSQKSVSDLLAGKVLITADIAVQLADASGTSAEYWMNLESACHT